MLLLSVDRPLTIGRNPEAWYVGTLVLLDVNSNLDPSSYVVPDPVVSSVHCKIYAYVFMSFCAYLQRLDPSPAFAQATEDLSCLVRY